MQIELEHILPCFEGLIPATLATCSKEGIPNITYLSAVHFIDKNHIALSYQFFNKSRENVLENPVAQLMVVDPHTMDQYHLDVEYVQTETCGKTFDKMKNTLDAIAAMTGMEGVFKLEGADIYRVHECKPSHTDDKQETQKYQIGHLDALAELTTKMSASTSLDHLFPTCLEGMAQLFNYDHAMLLVPNETGEQLYTIASRGYEHSGVGSEVAIGDGILGMVAQQKRPVRITHFERDLRMANAINSSEQEKTTKEIALPGIRNLQSQLALPLISQGNLLGVICMESEQAGRFVTEDEHVGSVLANHLSTCMALLSLAELEEPIQEPVSESSIAEEEHSAINIKFYEEDKSLFVNDDYIIKGLPGQILWKLLNSYQNDGRNAFTNREIRLDSSLNLPPVKDNLEARLILLKQRLRERCELIQIEKTGRGQFKLIINRSLQLEKY